MGLADKQVEAKYPKGTVFYDLVGNRKFVSTGKLSYYNEFDNYKNEYYINVQSNIYGNKTARVYKEGKWAKKVIKNYELWER